MNVECLVENLYVTGCPPWRQPREMTSSCMHLQAMLLPLHTLHFIDYTLWLTRFLSAAICHLHDSVIVYRQFETDRDNINRWSKNFGERLHRMSCRYWALNNRFAAYTAADIPNAFQWVRQYNPKISRCRARISASIEYMVHWAHVSQPPNGISIGSAVFAQYINVTDTQTDNRPRYVRHL